jgi:hypothetical protein
MKLVHVEVKLPPLQKHIAKYAVLKDRSAEEIRNFVVVHPGVFVFPFATKTVEECHDYTELGSGEAIYDHLVMPMYIGNFKVEDQERLIMECVVRSLDGGLDGSNELMEVE